MVTECLDQCMIYISVLKGKKKQAQYITWKLWESALQVCSSVFDL